MKNKNKDGEFNDDDEEASYYKAAAFPYFELKFGGGIKNFIIIHLLTGGSSYVGESSRNMKHGKTVSTKIIDKNTPITAIKFGPGITVYPFKNIHSPLNGLFIVTSFVEEIYEINHVIEINNSSNEILTSGGQIDLGKDWWISDVWSAGIEFGINYSTTWSALFEGKNDAKAIKFNAALRLVRR